MEDNLVESRESPALFWREDFIIIIIQSTPFNQPHHRTITPALMTWLLRRGSEAAAV